MKAFQQRQAAARLVFVSLTDASARAAATELSQRTRLSRWAIV